MLLMAVTVPTWGLMFFLIGTIVYPFYYATPENRFEELFYDYIPQWIVPQDLEAIKGYYEGLPRGTPIPWEAWVEPMAWWLGAGGGDGVHADLPQRHPAPPVVDPRAPRLPDDAAAAGDARRRRGGRVEGGSPCSGTRSCGWGSPFPSCT